jgi:hypothetical protein
MRKFVFILFIMSSTAAFTATSAASHLPMGAQEGRSAAMLANPVNVQMSCDLYSGNFDGSTYNIKLLSSGKGKVFNLGTPTDLNVKFPSPYNEYSVSFHQSTLDYVDIDKYRSTPFIQTVFVKNDTPVSEVHETNFSIESANSGSFIRLHGAYYPNIEPHTNIFYLCKITFMQYAKINNSNFIR